MNTSTYDDANVIGRWRRSDRTGSDPADGTATDASAPIETFLAESARRPAAAMGGAATGTDTVPADTVDPPVVIRVIGAAAAAAPAFRGRFRGQVEGARRCRDGFTTVVVDADLDAPRPWVATALVPAITLDQAVALGGPLDPSAMRRLACALVGCLNAVHSADILHGRFTPASVLLTTDGVRLAGAEVPGVWLPRRDAYRAPEHDTAVQLTRACDVYSVGTVLAFAATGAWKPGNPARLPPTVANGPVGGLIAACLARNPEDRLELNELPADIVAAIAANGPADEAVASTPPQWLPPAAAATLAARVEELCTRFGDRIAQPTSTTTAAPPAEASNDSPTSTFNTAANDVPADHGTAAWNVTHDASLPAVCATSGLRRSRLRIAAVGATALVLLVGAAMIGSNLDRNDDDPTPVAAKSTWSQPPTPAARPSTTSPMPSPTPTSPSPSPSPSHWSPTPTDEDDGSYPGEDEDEPTPTTTPTRSVKITGTHLTYNVVNNGYQGMTVSFQLDITGYRSKGVKVCGLVATATEYKVNPAALAWAQDGYLATCSVVTPPYDSAQYKSIALFLPYPELQRSLGVGQWSLRMYPAVYDSSNELVRIDSYVAFTYTHG